MKTAAALLLLLGVLRHYLWEILPTESQALAWNAMGATVILIFLWMLAYKWRATVLIAIWWSFEELQVIGCSTWLLLRPQDVAPGQGLCSSLLGFDLSTVGILLVAIVLVLVPVSSCRSQKGKALS